MLSENMKKTLRLFAPYLAVGVFWCVFSNAWLAILAYHAQILFWSRGKASDLRCTGSKRVLLLALPAAAAGPLLYFLLPYMTEADLSSWLSGHHLSRPSLLVMIPYFGIVHPILEQLHWDPLREETPVSHPIFAGYHMLVLYSLLTVPWLIASFIVFTTASVLWKQTAKRTSSLALPVLSHILSDLGLILAAYFFSCSLV
jgi:hypothetical protein